MISDELYENLVELKLVDTFRKPTFEELWSLLPLHIAIENANYWLLLEKLKRYDRISYYLQNEELVAPEIAIEYDNSEIGTITLSDLAAEMLIEFKNRGLL